MSEAHPEVMIVGQGPGYYEDTEGKVFVGPSGRWLQQFLARLEVGWILTNATRCYPGRDEKGGDNKPTRKQIEACATYLNADIQKWKPKVILCLGEVAMKAVLGNQAFTKVGEAKKNIVDLNGIKVLTQYHPVMHVTGRMDLFDDYITTFTLAEKICQGTFKEDKFDYKLVTSPEEAEEQLTLLESIGRDGELIAIDVETAESKHNLQRKTIWHYDARLLSLAFTYWYKGHYHNVVLAKDALTPEIAYRLMAGRIIVGHNLKFDAAAIWRFFGFNPMDVAKSYEDTFLLFYLQDQSRHGNGLKDLAHKFFMSGDWSSKVKHALKVERIKLKDMNKAIHSENRVRRKEKRPVLRPFPVQFIDFESVPLHILAEYNARDTYYTLRIYREKFGSSEEEIPPAYEMNRQAINSLAKLEYAGLPVDEKGLYILQSAAKLQREEVEKILQKIPEVKQVVEGWRSLEGVEFDSCELNVKSPKFLTSLAHRLNYHTWQRTESGNLQFNKETWPVIAPNPKYSELTRQQKVWRLVYCSRQLRHMSDVFLKSYLEYSVGGRIHTTFKAGKVVSSTEEFGADAAGQGGIESGRVGSSNPNITNVTKKSKHLRRRFSPVSKNRRVGEIDYSRMELVILAWLSKDPTMCAALEKGMDLHWITGRGLLNLTGSFDETNPKHVEARNWGKTMNFAIIYGQLPETFAEKNGIPFQDAVAYYKRFFQTYYRIKPYLDEVDKLIYNEGRLTTPWGRIRTVPDMITNHVVLEFRNYLVQSTAADIALFKLIEIHKWIEEESLQGIIVPVNLVYDSIWFEYEAGREDLLLRAREIMVDRKTLPIDLTLPLNADIKSGYSFGDLEELLV